LAQKCPAAGAEQLGQVVDGAVMRQS
jgi:hypothetical protein